MRGRIITVRGRIIIGVLMHLRWNTFSQELDSICGHVLANLLRHLLREKRASNSLATPHATPTHLVKPPEQDRADHAGHVVLQSSQES